MSSSSSSTSKAIVSEIDNMISMLDSVPTQPKQQPQPQQPQQTKKMNAKMDEKESETQSYLNAGRTAGTAPNDCSLDMQNVLKETSKKKGKSKSHKNPNELQLPATPALPTAKVKLPWMNEPIAMQVLMFYHSRPHIFGCQFSNLFYSPIAVNTRWKVPTQDGTTQLLLTYEKSEVILDEKQDTDSLESNMQTFQSSESVFQSAKAEHKTDVLFVQSLSPGDAARAGQGRLKMNNGLANKYSKFGGAPFRAADNHWQFSEHNKRYTVRGNWHVYKKEIMNHALRIKFMTYYNLMREYVDCEVPVYFVEHTKNDTQWADGMDGKGTNFLGKLLTTLCFEFRKLKEKDSKFGSGTDTLGALDTMQWSIDTLSDTFLQWMEMANIKLIEDGGAFYAKHKA